MDRSLDDSTRAWFDRLDALPEAERAAALARIPDAARRAEVASLFGAIEGRGAFLETPLFAAPETAPTTGEGRRVGPWRILRLLGEGGMGAVWLGERADGRFERQVALKFLRGAVFSGLASERFREEVSILGALDHPGIARLLDAGNADDGSAYLVTEFVDGQTLDAWCRESRPPLRARLRVFAELCEAVSYAHRALVVHRDLKPGNILIAKDGSPKLLDFGLARLVAPGGGSASARDLSLLRAFTPAYASPEQIEGQPVSTATDVFSLGVLLYELCTDRHPFRREGDEIATLAAVLREDPTPASRASGEAQLRGDLDTILQRALEKIPAQRYADARELGEDVTRHLQNRPIRARRASLGYRAGKWMRRQPGLAAAAAAVLLAILGGATISQIERNRALRGEAEAVRQRDLARQMALVMVDELGANLARMTGPTEARVRLLEKAAEALALAAPDDAARARAEFQLAKAYRSLGKLDAALAHAQSGRRAVGAEPLVAASLASIEGEVRAARFQRPAAVEAFRAAQKSLEGIGAGQLRTLPEAQAWTNVRSNVALLTANSGKFAEAGAMYAEILTAARAWLERWKDDPELLRLTGKAAAGLSSVARGEGKREMAQATEAEALRWLRRAVELAPNDPGIRHTFANVLGFLAMRHVATPAEKAAGMIAMREARGEKRRLLQADPSNVIFAFEFLATCGDLAGWEMKLDPPEVARATLDEAVAVARRFAAVGATEQRLASAAAGCFSALAFWHIERGDNEAAIAQVQEALPILEASLRKDYASTVARGLLADSLSLLGELQGRTKQFRAAEVTYWTALWWRRNEIRESGTVAHTTWLAQTLLGFGEMLSAAGRREESTAPWREALGLLENLHAQGKLDEESDAWTKERPKLVGYLKAQP